MTRTWRNVRFVPIPDINDHRVASDEAASGARVRTLMGDNPTRYGFKECLDELSAIVHHATYDGRTKRQLDPAELFHPSTLDVPGGV
jgi:hypothetical protein